MRPMPARLILAAGALVATGLLGACVQEPAMEPDTTAEDTAAVDTLRGAWEQAYEAGDASALAGLYTSDATFMAPGMPTMSGRAAIEAYYAKEFAMGGTRTVEIRPGRTAVGGDIGHEFGVFTGTVTPPDGDPVSAEGRYAVLLRRDTDGAWRIAAGIDNVASPEAMKMMLDQMMMMSSGAEGGGS